MAEIEHRRPALRGIWSIGVGVAVVVVCSGQVSDLAIGDVFITNCAIGDLATANCAIGGIPLLGLTGGGKIRS